MNCETARVELLEADPIVLAGAGLDPLSEHVHDCARCRAIAERLLEGERELAVGLDADAVGPTPELVEAILLTAKKRRRARTLWMPALAAATIAALLVWPKGAPIPVDRGVPTRERAVVVGPHVDPPDGRDVAVIPTKDPSITVVWLLGGGD